MGGKGSRTAGLQNIITKKQRHPPQPLSPSLFFLHAWRTPIALSAAHLLYACTGSILNVHHILHRKEFTFTTAVTLQKSITSWNDSSREKKQGASIKVKQSHGNEAPPRVSARHLLR